MMKTVCIVFIVGFAMENLCASAQQHTVHACKDGTLHLICLAGLIQVDDIVLADSSCYGSRCCPRRNDCRGRPSDNYRDQVNAACNGQSLCAMNVEIRNIGCGLFAPRNDYTNVTYRCIVTTTSSVSTILTTTTTPFPTTSSSSSASPSTWQHSTESTSAPVDPIPKNRVVNMGQEVTLAIQTPNNPPSFASDDKKATETEKEEALDTTPSQLSLDVSKKPNQTHALKTGKGTPGLEQGNLASHAQTDQEDKEYGYLDRINTLVAVIVGGVVILAIVISVAVVLALKKRRTAKTEEHYDMPNNSCSPNIDNANVRNSNIYDFIPDSGDCSASNYTGLECTTANESAYLTPVGLMESKEAPYMTVL